MSRTDQYNVTASVTYKVNGSPQTKDLGTFDTFDGGEIDSEETKFNPGGMGQTKSLGGRRSVGNVTISRNYEYGRDHLLVGWLAGGVGKADFVITKTFLDVDGNAYDRPITYRGKLKTVTPPSHDSESSDAAMIELEMSSATMTQ